MGTEITIFEADRKARFLATLSLCGAVNQSSQAAGISPHTVRTHLKADPEFKLAYDEAMQDFKEGIEREVMRRAIMGWEEDVFQLGEFVGTVRKFSDRMLELLAKRHIPEYKEKFQIDHNVSGGVLVTPGRQLDWEERYDPARICPAESDAETE